MFDTQRLFYLGLISMVPPSIAAAAPHTTKPVTLDGTVWELTRQADHCEARVETAIADYKRMPIYNTVREVSGDRFLVNSTDECWIELSIAGVDDVSLLFKVSRDLIVSDRRSMSWWGPTIYPYPSEPNGL